MTKEKETPIGTADYNTGRFVLLPIAVLMAISIFLCLFLIPNADYERSCEISSNENFLMLSLFTYINSRQLIELSKSYPELCFAVNSAVVGNAFGSIMVLWTYIFEIFLNAPSRFLVKPGKKFYLSLLTIILASIFALYVSYALSKGSSILESFRNYGIFYLKTRSSVLSVGGYFVFCLVSIAVIRTLRYHFKVRFGVHPV